MVPRWEKTSKICWSDRLFRLRRTGKGGSGSLCCWMLEKDEHQASGMGLRTGSAGRSFGPRICPEHDRKPRHAAVLKWTSSGGRVPPAACRRSGSPNNPQGPEIKCPSSMGTNSWSRPKNKSPEIESPGPFPRKPNSLHKGSHSNWLHYGGLHVHGIDGICQCLAQTRSERGGTHRAVGGRGWPYLGESSINPR